MISIENILLILTIGVLLYCVCSNKDFFTNILRPLDFVGRTCENNNQGKFCNNTECYYDQRYILQYNDYYKMIENLMSKLGNRTIDDKDLNEVNSCCISEYQIKSLLNYKIKEVILNNDIFNKNGSFKYEDFQVFDIEPKYYITSTGINIVKVIFSLHNTYRNTTTTAYALISLKDNELSIEYAGLIFSNVEEHKNVINEETPYEFNILDSLQKVQPSSYLNIDNSYNIKGGISQKTEQFIDKYFNQNHYQSQTSF